MQVGKDSGGNLTPSGLTASGGGRLPGGSRPAAAAPVVPVAPAPDAVRRQDLPENVRQQLPALTVAGATYSENPRYRMVIINGQVVQEGDTAAPGVVLETIRPKEVVLRAQGYRFTERY